MKEIEVEAGEVKKTYKDFHLQASYYIQSNMLRLLMNKYSIKVLDDMYDKKTDKFKFFTIISGENLSSIITNNVLVLKAKIDMNYINTSNISSILTEIGEKIIQELEVYKTIDYLDSETFHINYDLLNPMIIDNLIDYLTKSDSELANIILMGNLEPKLVDELFVDKIQIYNNTPIINVDDDMMNKETTIRALKNLRMQYAKYENNPMLKTKFEEDIKKLEEHLKNFE